MSDVITSVIYDPPSGTYYDQAGDVISENDAMAALAEGVQMYEYGSGYSFTSPPPSALTYDPNSGEYFDDMGNVVSSSQANQYIAQGVPLYQYGTGTPLNPNLTPKTGPVSSSISAPKTVISVTVPKAASSSVLSPAPPATSSPPGFFTELQAWLATGNNGMYAFGGFAILALAFALGGKRRR